jgi:hypothetical protein
MINVCTIKLFFFFPNKKIDMRDKLHISILVRRDYSERVETIKTILNSGLTGK